MRSVLLFLALTFAVTLPCQAQDAKPNTLTPKEIADGWILLFDGETTFGWTASHPGRGPKVAEGVLLLPSNAKGFVPDNQRIYTTATFLEFEMHLEYKLQNGEARVGVAFPDGIPPGIKPDGPNPPDGLSLGHRPLEKAATWTTYRTRSSGKSIERANANGPFEKGMTLSGPLPPMRILFSQENGSDLQLRNVKLKPLNAKPLFNGKDLTGWKTFPGERYKSKFTVTDKGELNVQDGPGDLQTTGKYQNFILQLDCISHGKHLNSGIFFRCRDNEYQNGYEAQIRNQFVAEPTQEYTIEEYDPKTNKLVEKKKIKSTAVDYGTGAIYRRQPARKEMSKDGEWFSMTIIAHGNHVANWVNGVQVTDWTDHRPVSDNARTGRKLEAGHISIQGHDPTTNLSFRNLRIAELPSAK